MRIHEMKLNCEPFTAVKSGSKTIEMRLYDEKRILIKQGDEIIFTNVTTGETLRCLVLQLYVYPTFEELYLYHDKISLGYKLDEPANAKDMTVYYPQEKIERYGVVGIEIRVL